MRFTRSLFLRCLGAVYCIAFLSLGSQIEGLIGGRGILPAQEFLRAVAERYGLERFLLLPTLAWLDARDTALLGMCLAGAILSALSVALPLRWPLFLGSWVLYLSLANIGRDFLMFQWDSLLLETGFLAVWWAGTREPQPAVTWPFRLLICRLMFLSGLSKLTSGDETWRGLTALQHHFETQPLPTPLAWYAHQLPTWALQASAGAMFLIELALPLLLLAPRRIRFVAAAGFALLQAVIFATGNYTFFNLLTLALCLPLLDDGVFGKPVEPAPRLTLLSLVPAAIIAISLFVPALGRFHLFNSYGLFAVMTVTRPEIVVEGSEDGSAWFAYEFRYKPGDLARAPALVAPHQPRLDWQMWFAALGTFRQNPWFAAFLQKLLEGSPEVLALLAANPFPKGPPRYVRARLYEYRFTDRSAGARDWWRREWKGEYCPAVSLRR
jgi:uncharacterized membrane protein YphA (DoxX/SURF4 family)